MIWLFLVAGKVGSGEFIKVWTDPWLPDDEGPLLSTPAHSELQNITVSSLLCPENNRWDMDVLQDIFAERDIQRILRIPRGSGSNDDNWMWIDDEKGLYTVKTGYRRLMREFQVPVPNQENFNWQ